MPRIRGLKDDSRSFFGTVSAMPRIRGLKGRGHGVGVDLCAMPRIRGLKERLVPRGTISGAMPRIRGLKGDEAAKRCGTMLLSNGAMPVRAALSKNPLFDGVIGFSHVVTFGVLPFAIVVDGKAPFNTLQEFITASRATPGKYNYASAGNGSASHLSAELVK